MPHGTTARNQESGIHGGVGFHGLGALPLWKAVRPCASLCKEYASRPIGPNEAPISATG
jgi:hypothetical protein